MEGDIYGEDEVVTGVRVIDNNGVEHEIEVERDGTIYSHHDEADGYPDDPSERTNFEDEMVSQARRFAKWYVHYNAGHDTLAPHRNPDRIAGVVAAVMDLDSEAFDRYFGDLGRQLVSHTDPAVEGPVELDPAIPHGSTVVYHRNVYLDAGVGDLRGFHEDHAEAIGGLMAETPVDRLVDGLADLLGVGGDADEEDGALGSILDPPDLPAVDLAGVSDLYYQYGTEDGSRTVGGEGDFGRDPDARLDLLAADGPWTPAHVRAWVVYNLVCQIRDVYVGSGQVPPVPYRLLGFGIRKFLIKYDRFELYPEYYDPGLDVDWERAAEADGDDSPGLF